MPPVVIDACFVAALLTRETYTEFAREQFQAFEARTLTAPGLLSWELANILWKKTGRDALSTSERDAMLDHFDGLRIDLVPLALSPMKRLLLLGDRHRVTAYDAAYLEMAIRLEAPLATLDKPLTVAALSEGLVVLSPFA